MDATATQVEFRLRKGASLKERWIRAAAGVFVLLVAIPGLLHWGPNQFPNLGAFVALPLGSFLIAVALLESNEAWIITAAGIAIGRQRPLGGIRKRFIAAGDIAAIALRRTRIAYPAGFSLACQLGPGGRVISPPLPDITRANATAVAIARLLGVADPAPADNPLEASNAEIRIGRPMSLGKARFVRILLALALPKYAHRFTGTCWTIGRGELRIEQIALNGRPSLDLVAGPQVDTITIDRGRSKGDKHVIDIHLHDGRSFRSPDLTGEDHARALRAEIIRRLRLDPATAGA